MKSMIVGFIFGIFIGFFLGIAIVSGDDNK